MKNIIVGFSCPKKWKPFAWAIMKTLNTSYDHVYMKFHSATYSRDIIYQASSVMVNFMGPDVFDSNNNIVKEFSLSISDDNYIKLMQFCIDNAGKPYSIKEILGIFLVIIAKRLGKTISNPFKEGTSQFVCSTLGSYIIEDFANIALPEDYETMSPKDLYILLEKTNG
jgi:hypothetical protein